MTDGTNEVGDATVQDERKSGRLPKTLAYDGPLKANERRTLATVCADGAARIFYDLTDTAQPLRHSGVLLVGRRLVGWIVRMDYQDRRAEENHTAQVSMEGVLWSFEATGSNPSSDRLDLLNITLGTYVERDGELHEQVQTSWDSSICERLIKQFGSIRIYRFDHLATPSWYRERERCLVPKEVGAHWECISCWEATARARLELSASVWRLPSHLRRVQYHGLQLDLKSISEPGWDEAALGGSEDFVAGLVEIRCKHTGSGYGDMEIVARRAWRDTGWNFRMKGGVGNASFQEYPIDDGWTALYLVELAFAEGRVFRGSFDPMPQKGRPFQAVLSDARKRAAKLSFVLQGGMERP